MSGGVSSADFERLRLSFEEVAKTEREMVELMRRGRSADGMHGAAGGQSGQVAAPASGGVGPGRNPFDGALTSSLGAVAGRLSSTPGGAGALAGVAAGVATGGLAGGAIAAVSTAAGFFANRLTVQHNTQQSMYDVITNAPLSDSHQMIKRRQQQAMELGLIDEEEAKEDVYLTADGMKKQARRRVSRAYERRLRNQQAEDDIEPEERARARARSMFQGFARSGGLETERGQKLFEHTLQRLRDQENHAQNMERLMRMNNRALNSTLPNSGGDQKR